jgi:pre-mRNA-processing factor 40
LANLFRRQQTFVAGGTSNFSQYNSRDDYNDRPSDQRAITYPQPEAVRATLSTAVDPEYASLEEAEGAFFKLLKRSGVQPDWTWEQAMRATIKDPQYRAVKDPKDRRAAFDKYIVDLKVQEKDRAKERLAKLRSDFGTMLKRHPEIKHYTRWKTARPMIEGETIFRSTDDDEERRQLFDEYIFELKKQHSEQEADIRKSAMDELSTILNALKLEPYTRWAEAQEILDTNERFQKDEKFRKLHKLDVLKVFESHIKSLERTFNDARQTQKNQRARLERQNRDKFMELLRQLEGQGLIKAGTKWKDFLPHIEDDPRYQAMLGQSGSTPLDFFWDIVEEHERGLRSKQYDVSDVLDVSIAGQSRPLLPLTWNRNAVSMSPLRNPWKTSCP